MSEALPYQRKEIIGDAVHRWKCEQCEAGFSRAKSGSRPIRFCSQKCYHENAKANNAYKGTFVAGNSPWNKDLKGIHLSPASEFVKGCASNKASPLGAETIRFDKSGQPRAYVKIGSPSHWRQRAVVVWEAENGPLPSGHVIHHKDRDPMNDSIENLQCLTRSAHINEHRDELRAA